MIEWGGGVEASMLADPHPDCHSTVALHRACRGRAVDVKTGSGQGEGVGAGVARPAGRARAAWRDPAHIPRWRVRGVLVSFDHVWARRRPKEDVCLPGR
jgi:hypothetical protein